MFPIKEDAMGDRRSFLAGAGASVLAIAFLQPAEAGVFPNAVAAGARVVGGTIIPRTPIEAYVGGLVSNRDLPGLSGQLLLNVYLSVENGTGVGTISDPAHPQVNSHVEIHESRRHGNEFQFDGVVILSNDPTRVGQQVLIVATVQGDFT